MTRILIDHGYSRNLGDLSTCEGVVRRLRSLLPSAGIHLIDKPGGFFSCEALSAASAVRGYDVRPVRHNALRRMLPSPVRQYWTSAACRRGLMATGHPGDLRLGGSEGRAGRTLLDYCGPYDALILAGGGYMTDLFPLEVFRKCMLIDTFLSLGRKVILTGQQIGPFSSREVGGAVARRLARADYVGLREGAASPEAAGLLRGSGNWSVMGDDAFGAPPADPGQVKACLDALGIGTRPFLAMNLRQGHYADRSGRSAAVLGCLAAELSKMFSMPVLIVPISKNATDDDVRAGRLAAASATGGEILPPEDGLSAALTRGILGRAFGAFGSSYHFCVFALSQGVPAVSLHTGDYYGQKARGLASFWNDDRFVMPLDMTDPVRMASRIAEVFRDQALRAALAKRAEDAKTEWAREFDLRVGALLGQHPEARMRADTAGRRTQS